MSLLIKLAMLWAALYAFARVIDHFSWKYAPDEYKWAHHPRRKGVTVRDAQGNIIYQSKGAKHDDQKR